MQKTIFASAAGLGALVVAVGACNSVATTEGFTEGMPPGGESSGGFSGGSSGGSGGSAMFTPTFGTTVRATRPPPAISGGTLLVMKDGTTAIAADPDRDEVSIVDLVKERLAYTVTLQPGDEPGRVAEDGAGRVHVALRGGGALVTIDPATGTVLQRRAVCPAPRGVAWRAVDDVVLVACATGELVTLPSASGAPTSSVYVQRDLRDVLVGASGTMLSTFRASEVLRVDGTGKVSATLQIPEQEAAAHVAWRTFADAQGEVYVVHQTQSLVAIPTQSPGAYGGDGASPVVESVVTIFNPDGSLNTELPIADAVLPVDAAISPDGTQLIVAAAGNAFSPQLGTLAWVNLQPEAPSQPTSLPSPQGQVTAVAFDAAGDLLAQSREPAELWVLKPGGTFFSGILLDPASRDDTGHDIFHTQAGALVACASCHPEAGDDGHVWTFDSDERRTASLRGTIAGTAPYHWPGDEPDMNALVNDVYEGRMSGQPLMPDQMAALQGWVEAVPAPPAPTWVDASAAARGQALFEGAQAGCSSCHSGAKLTNNQTLDVGTGAAFQVPPLVGVGWRAPFLHDGCAATLADRFGSCATPAHGNTASLTTANVSDLVAYLETL